MSLMSRQACFSRVVGEDEEEELGWFLLGCASVGYPNTRKEVLSLVQSQILCH